MVTPLRSSRTISSSLHHPSLREDRDQPASRRFEPNSRHPFHDEQSYPWELLHPQDGWNRHRGAKLPRGCGLCGRHQPVIPDVPFVRYVAPLPLGSVRSLEPKILSYSPCLPRQPHSQVGICSYALPRSSVLVSQPSVHPRYPFEGHRPSETSTVFLSSLQVSGTR